MPSANSLAADLANIARELAGTLEIILRLEPAHPLQKLLEETNKTFSTVMETSEFADVCAQTITYGMFVERLNKWRKTLPKPLPFLRQLFDYIEGPYTDERIEPIIEEIDEFLSWGFFNLLEREVYFTRRDVDETIYFYEPFLEAYNPKQRKALGVFYTPYTVVMAMTRFVDAILRKEFNLRHGFADKVHILDPATGMGTFLYAVIGLIRDTFDRYGNPKAWESYVEKDLVPRLHGFEVLMTPYLLTHLKLAMRFKKEHRFNVHLANALEPHDEYKDFPLIILGNPPYNVSSENQNEYAKSLIEKYKEGLENETNIQPLSDDYIKFIALGQHLIGSNPQGGILAYISNNSFLDGVIHWRMRQSLMETFDKIYILNLHGNTRKKETTPSGGRDENIFKIMQGTSINVFIRSPVGKTADGRRQAEAGATIASSVVLYSELYGTRGKKTENLRYGIKPKNFKKIVPKAPDYFFVPKDMSLQAEYEKGFAVNELFIKHGTGIKFRKDNLLVKNHFTPHDVETMLQDIARLEDEQFLKKYDTEETKDWTLKEKRQYFLDYRISDIVPVLYRVFDMRWTYYPMDKVSQFIVRGDARKDLMKHLFRDNLVLLTLRNQPTVQDFDRVFIAKGIIEHCVIGRGTYAFPLYCYDENGERRLNLNKEIVRKLISEPQSLDCAYVSQSKDCGSVILDYVYGVLHDPAYRARYQEFLKIDFPRVPFPKDAEEFERYVQIGSRLRKMHLLEDVPTFQTTFPISGNNEIRNVKNVRFVDDKVFINETQYFENVPESVWNFFIGGSCPAQKYLKDRKGRVLSSEEIQHYQKIVAVLKETILVQQSQFGYDRTKS